VLKKQCIDATDLWKSAGRPRDIQVNSNHRCKLKYKSAVKEAAASADPIFNIFIIIHQ